MYSANGNSAREVVVQQKFVCSTTTNYYYYKAAEIMGMSRLEFSALLKTIGFKYSYLDEKGSREEVKAIKSLLKKRCS